MRSKFNNFDFLRDCQLWTSNNDVAELRNLISFIFKNSMANSEWLFIVLHLFPFKIRCWTFDVHFFSVNLPQSPSVKITWRSSHPRPPSCSERCFMLPALCSMHYALCPMRNALCFLPHIPTSKFSSLSSVICRQTTYPRPPWLWSLGHLRRSQFFSPVKGDCRANARSFLPTADA